MIPALVLAVALQQPALFVADSYEKFDGASWCGLKFGMKEGEVKKAFRTAKTPTADPASVRLKTAEDRQIITALFTKQGGKGDLIGFGIEMEGDRGFGTLEELESHLGKLDTPRFFPIRTSRWMVAAWPDKGVAATVDEHSGSVLKILLAEPQALAHRTSSLATQGARMSETTDFPIRDIYVSVSTRPRNQRQEDILRSSLNLSAFDWLRGSRTFHRGGSSDSIDVSVSISTGSKDRSISASTSLTLHTEFGDVSASGSDSETARDDIEVGALSQTAVRRALDSLAKSVDQSMRRKVWQAEWRPFYDLARG